MAPSILTHPLLHFNIVFSSILDFPLRKAFYPADLLFLQTVHAREPGWKGYLQLGRERKREEERGRERSEMQTEEEREARGRERERGRERKREEVRGRERKREKERERERRDRERVTTSRTCFGQSQARHVMNHLARVLSLQHLHIRLRH
jgi:hypothetical protein